MDKQDYKELFQNLMPQGPAWSRDPDSFMDKIAKGIGSFFYSIALDLEKVLDEIFPQTDTAFPQLCDYGNIANKDYFEAVCHYYGVHVQIVEFSPFMFGVSYCGVDQCGPEEIVFYWNVNILSGEDEAVQNVMSFILKNKQSHTTVFFFDKRETEGE